MLDIDLKELSIKEMLEAYMNTRDALDVKRKEYQHYEANAKDLLERISMALRDKADEQGVDNFTVKGFATAYRNTKTSYRVSDWDAVVKYIQDTGNFQMLEKRVAKLAVAEIHKETGEIPPGLDFHLEVEFNVRRA
jgi:hypothetical protein